MLSVFLILLILVQQGRGGGLTGALGGPGGQSAFGTKAGDVFTKITIIAASIWIVLAAVAVRVYTEPNAASALSNTTVNQTSTAPINVNEPPPAMGGNLNPAAPTEEMSPAPGVATPVSPSDANATPVSPSKTTAPAQAEVDPKTEAPLTFETPASTTEPAPAPQNPAPSEPSSTDGAAEQPKP